MKITFVPHKPLPDRDADAEQLVNSAAALARAGHEVTLLAPCYPGQTAPDASMLADYYKLEGNFSVAGQAIPNLPHPFLRSLYHAVKSLRHPAVRNADVVFTRRLEMLAPGLLCGLNMAFDHYRPWGDNLPMLRPFFRWALRRRNFVAAFLHSGFAAESYKRLGVRQDKIFVAHNGYTPAIMEPRLSRLEARKKLDLPPDIPVVTYAGRLSQTKGLDQLMAMAGKLPDVRFLLVGGTGGPLEKAAARFANITIIPWQPFDALPPYLYAADILVIPPSCAPLQKHKNAVLPIKTFLYLAAGRPILAPVSPDTEELLIHGETAYLVAPDDPGRAAAAVRELIGNAELAATLTKGALRLAQNLTWDKRGQKISAVLREKLKTGSAVS